MSTTSDPKLYLFIDDLQKLVVNTPEDSIISRTIHKADAANVVLFAFAAGQALSEHTAAQDAILHFLAGEATVTLGEDTYEAHAGTWIHMQARLPHSVVAKTPVSMLLILVFAVWLNWLPASGWGKPERWILPIAAYAAIPLATYARYTRSAVLDTLNRPFVTALRAKGLGENRIIFLHVLRNSAIPMVTVFLPMFIGTATGSIFVEAMFRVPGLGSYFVSSIENRDYPLEMALVLMVTFFYCVAYLISDIAYAWLNPRIRFGERGR